MLNLNQRTFLFFLVCIAVFIAGRLSSEITLLANYYSKGSTASPVLPKSSSSEEDEEIESTKIENNTKLYYVHIGKTGGSTLETQVLKFKCNRFQGSLGILCQNTTETHLSRATIHTSHGLDRFNNEKLKEATGFFYSIRNPISRAVSAYDMEHSRNREMSKRAKRAKALNAVWSHYIFYDLCYPDNAEQLALALHNQTHKLVSWTSSQTNETSQFDCFDFGKEVLQGNGHIMASSHIILNYAFYVEKTLRKYPEKDIYIIRAENLWDDVKELNYQLGGPHDDNSWHGAKGHDGHTHGSESYVVKSRLSEKGKKTFCCYLSKENQIFEELVVRAVNINAPEKMAYLDSLYDDCGIDSGKRVYDGTFPWDKWSGLVCPE